MQIEIAIAGSDSTKKKMIAELWKRINPDDKFKPAAAKKTHAYREDIADAAGVDIYDKFSLNDLSEEQLRVLGAAFGLKL